VALDLDPTRKAALLDRLTRAYAEEFDDTLSEFRAEALLDLVIKAVGPAVYNQGVQDARAFFQAKLDDLDGDVHEPEL